jgi:hypothetical protein
VVRRGALAWMVAILMAGIGVPVRAQTGPAGTDDDQRAVEARKACIAGDVDRGVRLLAEYFAATEDAIAVYNIGRCYEQNGLDGKAVPRFREYLLKAKDLGPAEREEIEKHIKVLEDRQSHPSAPTSVRKATDDARVPPTATLAVRPDDTTAPGNKRLRVTGLALGGVGVAALGTGAVFALQVRSTNDDLAAERRKASPEASRYTALQQSGRRAQSLQWVSLGVGAAALAAGATCYLFGRPSKEEARVAIAPWLGLQARGADLRVSF